MKMRLIQSFILIFIFGSFLFTGCSKRRGCADVNACNFDASAEKNDGSCTYETPWYLDSDGDGLGDPSQFIMQCNQPLGYVNNANGSIGQPAIDFVSTDCNGAPHHLFAELDAGIIVVMIWVMPCSSCTPYAIDCKNIVDSYTSSHPGRVVYYIVDDYANTSCSNIEAWASWYGLSSVTKFSDANIKMSDYGVDGMPKIVAFAGTNHQVYFNKNSSTTGLTDAINQALIDNP